MPSVTVEYVILIPLLFTQVIIFPMVASTMTSSWQNTQRDIELQDAANHLVSTIQQFYLTINSDDILACNVTQASTVPITVASYPYSATCSLSDPSDGSAKILTVSLVLDEVANAANASTVLGPNVEWIDSTLRSNSAAAYIKVEKKDGTLTFSFGG